ncbi:MAG: single-stranded-DNA-specific exonuclease RecJ [Patescibacteria group bacterium]
MLKDWRINPEAPVEFKQEMNAYHPLVAQLLYNRGLVSQNQIDLFFNTGYERAHDPFLFVDMKKAVERIWRVVENKEKVLIHGDYDADGVTSAAVLYKTLKTIGANVEVFIPHREIDGYGLNLNSVNNFCVQGVNLLITVDCGITNVVEIKALNEAGIDVIITDHHLPPQILPEAFAILDPKVENCGYPFSGLSGAGVAFKFAQAIFSDARIENYSAALLPSGGAKGFLKWLLDIVAIGTVADVSPMIDENRILVKWGLVVLRQTRNLGLKELLETMSAKKIDSYTIGFQIAPRLNAAGRMNHASAAFELLIAEDTDRAKQLALDLQKNNSERQKAIEIAIATARLQVEAQLGNRMIFVYDENWLPGLIGLIAGKICDEHYRPVLAMTKCHDKIVGSGRSVPEFDITHELTLVSELLARFGGHKQACGFTLAGIELLDKFRNCLSGQAQEKLAGVELVPFLNIEAELELEKIKIELVKTINGFAPFGENNPVPLFVIKNLQIVAMDALGSQSTHLRLSVRKNNSRSYKLLFFSQAEKYLKMIQPGDTIDAVCELGVNEWNGNREVEFKGVDLKLTKRD